jgi:hypothetical protein
MIKIFVGKQLIKNNIIQWKFVEIFDFVNISFRSQKLICDFPIKLIFSTSKKIFKFNFQALNIKIEKLMKF